MKKLSQKVQCYLKHHQISINFLMILLLFGMITGVLLSKWINALDIEAFSTYLVSTILTDVDSKTFFLSQFVTNSIFLFLIFFLGFSLIGIPFIAFIIFTKGVQIGFSCALYVLSYKLKGIIGIILTLVPQILFDVIAIFLVCIVSVELSYNICQKCFKSDKTLVLSQVLNQKLNSLLLSIIIIFISAYLKSTFVIKLMELFTMM